MGYVRWMTYWIVLASLTLVEFFADVILSFWFPFYYSLKVGFLVWLLSPLTEGSSFLYKEVLHPILSQKEEKIDRFSQNLWESVCHLVGRCFKEGIGKVGTAAAQSIYDINQGDTKKSNIDDTAISYEDMRDGKEESGTVKRREVEGRGNLTSRRKTSSLYEPIPAQKLDTWNRTQSLYDKLPKKNQSTISLGRLRREKKETRETEKTKEQ